MLRFTVVPYSIATRIEGLCNINSGTVKEESNRAMGKDPQEWMKQADYDMDTASFMFEGGRYFYAVFLCHLSIEKALKGLYLKKMEEIPPKVHNLVFLMNRIGVKPPEFIGKFMIKLNEAHIATRYPEEIENLYKNFTRSIVQDILTSSKEVLEWIREHY